VTLKHFLKLNKQCEEVPRTKLVTLCWICVPLYDTGRVVNMDNYYTSPKWSLH
jgi:hypothetical protein